MKLTLENLADRGCWISDDRVNAFISQAEQSPSSRSRQSRERDPSPAAGAIAEIGYHGTQPVSKNSRMFVGGENGALWLVLRRSDGTEHPVSFGEVDWTPSSVTVNDRYCNVQITTHQRSIRITVRLREEAEVALFLNLESLNLNAHGTRTWSEPEITADSIVFSCHDRIVLNEWLKRTGPYAGDFLIPEPMRRIIFDKPVRSGEAKVQDVYPEFRDAAIPIYDASVFVRIGGRDVRVDRQDGIVERRTSNVIPGPAMPRRASTRDPVILTAHAGPDRSTEFFILFGDQRSDVESFPLAPPVERTRHRIPSLGLPGYPAVQQFMDTVPGLVDSAIVRDHGMPRATPAAYYWIWAWDSMVTGMEMLRWGDYATTGRMAAFINSHRDKGGLIPMRWTRSLAPLDTPPRGALEFLYASFVYQYTLESGDLGQLTDAYPYLVNHLEMLGRESDDGGMFPGSGFYPDFAAKFGRTASSVVAMEVAAHYVFARILENIARLLSDESTEWRARETADRICGRLRPAVTSRLRLLSPASPGKHPGLRASSLRRRRPASRSSRPLTEGDDFLDRFWDDEKGFLFDAFDIETGAVNKSYPLFTMLFLQSSLGIPLIRSRIDALATFCSEELLGPFGTSLLPSWDRNRMNEDATASWYPHWDVYLLKILRRGGRSAEIMQWLGNVERVLEHLGYCPEFIKLHQNPADPASWLNHGAVSNLNCVTGWFRSILEGLFGIEVDPGGLNIIPLSLPIETLSLEGLVCKGTRWNAKVRNAGDHLEALIVDGTRWEGICKVPVRYYDGREHTLEVLYGPIEPDLQFREIINAELIDASRSGDSLSVTVRPLGTCDVVFFARRRPELYVDAEPAEFGFDEQSGIGMVRLRETGEVETREVETRVTLPS